MTHTRRRRAARFPWSCSRPRLRPATLRASRRSHSQVVASPRRAAQSHLFLACDSQEVWGRLIRVCPRGSGLRSHRCRGGPWSSCRTQLGGEGAVLPREGQERAVRDPVSVRVDLRRSSATWCRGSIHAYGWAAVEPWPSPHWRRLHLSLSLVRAREEWRVSARG